MKERTVAYCHSLWQGTPQTFILTIEEVPRDPILQHCPEQIPEAVDERPLAHDHDLQDQLGRGLHEALDGAQVVGLGQPAGLAGGANQPRIKVSSFVRHETSHQIL